MKKSTKKFVITSIIGLLIISTLVLVGDKFNKNTIGQAIGAVEVCGCDPELTWVYYFDWMENTWYRKDAYVDGKGDTTIYNIDSTDDYRYLMVHLIKDEDLGLPNTIEIKGIYVETLTPEKQVTLDNGEVIDNVLHLNLSSNFEFKEDGTPLGEVAVHYNIESIVNTFCLNNYGIDAVDFYFDGKKVDIIGGVLVQDYWLPTVTEETVEMKVEQ